MKYYYNQAENSFAIATNFIPDKTPDGYVEISEERYNELQEELNQEQITE